MRRRLVECRFCYLAETAERHLKCFLCLALSRTDRNHFSIRTAQFLVFLQNGLDADDHILDMWTCISLKGNKAVYIENVIFGRLIRKIGIFKCRQTDNLRRACHLVRRNLLLLLNLLIYLLIDILDQVLQTHNTALTCLERTTVLAVHRTEAQEDHRRIFFDDARLLRHTEYLDKMKLLALVYDVNVAVRMEILLTFDDRRQIGSRIQRRTIGFADDTRRIFLRIPFLCDIDNQRAIALIGKTLFL